MFDGKYHGHFDQALVAIGPDGALVPEEHGLPADVTEHTVLVPFNDLRRARGGARIAATSPLVLTEPAMTNNVGLILPDDGFHEGLRRLTRDAGTLLAYDETHTQVVGPGGLTAQWSLDPDFVTAGKSIAAGVPFGAWGMTRGDRDVPHAVQGPRRRALRHGRDRRHAVRQRAVDGRRAGDDARGAHAARRTRTRSGWAPGSPTACARAWIAPGCPGTSTHSALAPATRSDPSRSATPPRGARARTTCSRG